MKDIQLGLRQISLKEPLLLSLGKFG